MKILFAGGGTAGHINPAIAIAQIVSDRWSDSEIMFIGREEGDENKAIVKCGYPLSVISVRGLDRKISMSNAKAIISALKAVKSAEKIITEFNPDLIIGTGGYVCWPVLRAGKRLGVKTVIHESNAYPGLVTKLVSKHCDLTMLNFEGAARHLSRSANTKVVGNPLRKGFHTETRASAREKLGISPSDMLIVSFGGSLGSDKMNSTVVEVMSRHLVCAPRIRHIHATGKRHYPSLAKKYPSLARGKNGCKILPYIDNMPLLLCAADIAITRSGANTLSELSCAGVASILIPSPNVTGNHQYENAKYISDSGGAILLSEDMLTAESLSVTIKRLVDNAALRDEYSRAISSLAPRDTSDKIIGVIEDLTREMKKKRS